MLRQKIILIGGGGHCKACIDVIEQTNQYDIEGILDQPGLTGTDIFGYRIIGTDSDIVKYNDGTYQFLITVGQIKSADVRKKLSHILGDNALTAATVISPRAYVSKYASIGPGTIVMHGAIVNAGARIGDNCILNTGCIIEHDAVVGNYTHISTSAVINGGSGVGEGVFIGSNSAVSNQIRIGNDIVTGAGAIVIKDINEPGTYVGNPVIKIK